MSPSPSFSLRLKLLWRKLRGRPIRNPRERYPQHVFGRGTYGMPEVLDWKENARLKVGNYCSIARDVRILLGGEHRIDWVSTYPFTGKLPGLSHIKGHPRTRGDVIIGNDVWLGMGCTILSGVTIGDGAVVGAGAMVSKNVPPYMIVAGNPAREIRLRFSPEVVRHLLEIAWWHWPEERLAKAGALLVQADPWALINAVQKGEA